MKVKEFKELLAGMPDDYHIVIPTQDHEYRHVNEIYKTTALFDGRVINEDCGEEHTPQSEYGSRETVIVIV